MIDPRFRPAVITMGDPAGIGPEIIVKLAAVSAQGLPAIVAGDTAQLRATARWLSLPLAISELTDAANAARPTPGVLQVLQVGPPLPETLKLGRASAAAGSAAYRYVQAAIDLALAGKAWAIVTAPISKEAMAMAGIAYPGHTEILADRCGVRDYAMMLANGELRVLLVSIHVSLAQAIEAVTAEAELRAIRLAHRACRAYGIETPRIAVAGLNPHAGESGMFGRQEIEVIAPAVATARAEGLDVTGPWPGDTVFMRARRGEFDIVVAQYHDQGLIPVKYLGIEQGVNITVGLPFVRTSVDHGTAFDIAGKGEADPTSLRCALEQALAMSGPEP
jgi:4-hydroxythreonine-4-phosphate dehydrogenase